MDNYIFLLDDDGAYLKSLENHLTREFSKRVSEKKVEFRAFTSIEHCLEDMHLNPSLVILDYYLSSKKVGSSGMHLLEKLKTAYPEVDIIISSHNENIETAVRCLKYGASDYIIKNNRVFIRIQNAVKKTLENIESESSTKKEKIKTAFLQLLDYL